MLSMSTSPDIDNLVDELADLFHLLGDPTRLRIVLACLAQPTSVGEIAARLALSSSLVSHHLRLLRAARIVKAERQGKQVFYTAADAHMREYDLWVPGDAVASTDQGRTEWALEIMRVSMKADTRATADLALGDWLVAA